MANALLKLPLELIRQISLNLDLQDFVSLRDARLKLCNYMNDQHTSRPYVKVRPGFSMTITRETDKSQGHLFSSREAVLARRGVISYAEAIQRLYVTGARLVLAKPSFLIQLSCCDERYFREPFYGSGFLAYVLDDCIRILDVSGAAESEVVLDVDSCLLLKQDI